VKLCVAAACWCVVLVLLAGCVTTETPTNNTSLTIDPKAESSTAGREPELARELVAKADQQYAAKDYESALFLYREAIEFEDAAEIWLRLGNTQRKLRANNEALAAFTASLARDPDQPIVYQQVGLLYLNNGKAQTAQSNFERALAMDPSLWRSWNGLGVAADIRKEFELAGKHYRQAIELNPSSPMLWSNFGYSQYLAGDYSAAKTSFESALKLDTKFKPAWTNLGLVHARKAEYPSAIEILSQLQPVHVAYNDVGYIALLNEDWDTAQHLLQRAIDRSPRYYEVAQQNMALLDVRKDQQVLARISASEKATAAALEAPVQEEKSLATGSLVEDLEDETIANEPVVAATAEQNAASWLSSDRADQATRDRSAHCIESQFPGPCTVCAQTANPPLCMLEFLERFGK
jgi:Flp pilus assembly protein TadD